MSCFFFFTQNTAFGMRISDWGSDVCSSDLTWNAIARIVFESFAGLGLKASGTGFTAAELLQPGRVAQVGLDAGRPILDSIAELMGFVSFFENFIQIIVLLFAWAIVLLAFFVQIGRAHV